MFVVALLPSVRLRSVALNHYYLYLKSKQLQETERNSFVHVSKHSVAAEAARLPLFRRYPPATHPRLFL